MEHIPIRPEFRKAIIPAASFLLPLLASCGGQGTRGERPLDRESLAAPIEEVETGAEDAGPGGIPDAREVARRALVIHAVAAVRLYPRAGERLPPEAFERFEAEREGIVTWLKREGLWPSASPSEKEFLLTPIGAGRDREPPAASGREGLTAMLWAIGPVRRLPEFDDRGLSIPALAEALPAFGRSTASFVDFADLRAEKELALARDKASLWSLRARVREIVEKESFPDDSEMDGMIAELEDSARARRLSLNPIGDWPDFYHELVRVSAWDAYRRGWIGEPVDGDFPVGAEGSRPGRSRRAVGYGRVPDREAARIRSIAAERLHALEWILGDRPTWD